jgi:predicted Fe-Mo cluster-binding NifX family protein
MKIAVSVTASQPEADFDTRFGRAAAFVIVDTTSGEQLAVANPAARAGSGAGIRAAEFLVRQGVDAVISGAFGPKAYNVLHTAGLRLYQAKSGTAKELVDRLLNGELDVVKDG